MPRPTLAYRAMLKPEGRLELNRANPITRGMTVFIPFWRGAQFTDIDWNVYGSPQHPRTTIESGNPVTRRGAVGLGVRFDGASDVLNYDPNEGSADKSVLDSNDISVMVVARRDGTGDGEEGVVFRLDSFRLTVNSLGDQKARFLTFPTIANVFTNQPIRDGHDFALLGVGGATETAIYLDGDAATSGGGGVAASSYGLTVGSDFGKFKGLIYAVFYWRRTLTRAEGVSVTLNPRQLVRQVRRRIFSIPTVTITPPAASRRLALLGVG